MKYKLSVILLALVMILGLLTQSVLAASPPQTVSAPENFGVSNYGGHAIHCTLSAPDDLRVLIDMTDKERGYGMTIWGQVDFKTDNGNWHYSPAWDSVDTYRKYALSYYNALNGGDNKQYLGHERLSFKTTFPEETNVPVPAAFTSWDWYKAHSITVRARFAIDFGNKNIVFSDWSSEYVLSGNSRMDYKAIMNTYAPTLASSKLEENVLNKRPFVVLSLGRHPVEIEKFNAASGNSMRTEVWLRKSGDKDFKLISDAPFSYEVLKLDVSSYYGNNVSNYAAEAYEVKVRYKIDERAYQQSGAEFNWMYSPYSNTLSYGMPAWSGASAWATTELQKAKDLGLIPDILKGADMTKNITREEFAEVALLMYQKASGMTDTTAASPNPFTDLQNPQVLKAYKLGIVKGMSATTFEPKTLINREQVSAMLIRTVKLIAPDADYSTIGAPTFADQADISGWALNDCLYIAKLGIIKGSDGKFMPRAVTKAQTAAGYANTSREQAIAMSVRSVDKMNEIKESKPTSKAHSSTPATETSNNISAGQNEFVGFWGDSMTSLANFNSAGNYTGAGLSGNWWTFNADGTYTYIIMFNKDAAISKGKYTFDDNKLYLTGSAEKNYFSANDSYKDIPDKTYRYYFETVDENNLLRMTEFDFTELQYFDRYYKR